MARRWRVRESAGSVPGMSGAGALRHSRIFQRNRRAGRGIDQARFSAAASSARKPARPAPRRGQHGRDLPRVVPGPDHGPRRDAEHVAREVRHDGDGSTESTRPAGWAPPRLQGQVGQAGTRDAARPQEPAERHGGARDGERQPGQVQTANVRPAHAGDAEEVRAVQLEDAPPGQPGVRPQLRNGASVNGSGCARTPRRRRAPAPPPRPPRPSPRPPGQARPRTSGRDLPR